MYIYIIGILLICIIFIWIVDKVLIRTYCSIKKKIDQERFINGITFEGANEIKALSSKSFSRRIKLLCNGYVQWKINALAKVPSQKYRIFFLKNVFLMDISQNVLVYSGFEIRSPWNIEVGEGTIIGNSAILDGRNGIKFGKNVNLSSGVWIWTEQHDLQDAYFKDNDKGGKVVIGDRAWLSARTQILPKVEVGEGAVLAAGAVATKNLDAYTVYAGIPARKIGERNKNLVYEFNGEGIPFI